MYLLFTRSSMDLYIAQAISHFAQGSRVDDFSFLISWWFFLAPVLIIIIFFSFYADKKSRKQYLVALVIGAVLFYVCNELFFKHILPYVTWIRLRPYLAHPDLIRSIGDQIADSSFPSSHVASTVGVLSLFVWRTKTCLPLALFLWLLVCLSRIHNGMHYPSDVIAGWFLGVLYAYLAIQASKHMLKKTKSLE